MKKSLFFAALAAASLARPAAAQNSAVVNAVLNQRNGVLDKARADIDKAIVHEKTSGKAKTWYTRGEIYEQMTGNAIYGKLLQPGEGTQKAFESYQKAIALEGKDSEYGKLATAKLNNVYVAAFNEGISNYKAKDYDKALASFQMASTIQPTDTMAVLNIAAIYDEKQDMANAKASYNKLLATGYKSPTVYTRLFQIAKQEKDEKAAAQVMQQALQAYPNNKAFMLEELNMYLSSGRGKEAIDKIQRAIAADPKNSNLYAVLGSVYDQNKQPELALDAYKKAVEADPNNFDAQFNLGVYNYNRAAELYTKASKMNLATYQKSGKQLEVQGKKYFQDSVPYFEKALQLQPDDRNTLTSLQKVYFRLGRTADSERLSAKLQSLKK